MIRLAAYGIKIKNDQSGVDRTIEYSQSFHNEMQSFMGVASFIFKLPFLYILGWQGPNYPLFVTLLPSVLLWLGLQSKLLVQSKRKGKHSNRGVAGRAAFPFLSLLQQKESLPHHWEALFYAYYSNEAGGSFQSIVTVQPSVSSLRPRWIPVIVSYSFWDSSPIS